MNKMVWCLALTLLGAGGCFYVHSKATGSGNRGIPLTVCTGAFTRNETEPNQYEAHWTTRGLLLPGAGAVQFEIRLRPGDGSAQCYFLEIDDPAPWQGLAGNSSAETVEIRVDRPAGVMVLAGNRAGDTVQGLATLQPKEVYVRELAKIVGTRPGVEQTLALFFNPVDLDYARRIKAVLGDELTLDNLQTLSNYHVSSDYVQGSRAAGYTLSVEQLVRLRNYHIPLEMLRDFKGAGYDFSVDQLIRIRNYHLTAQDFSGFRAAGYDLSIDEMIRARNYHVPVEMVRTLHEAGFRYDLDEIVRLLNYHVPPDYIIAFHRSGYKLSVDEIIRARNYHVDAQNAARLKEMGYNFSLDELIRLQNYRVPMDFIAQVHHPDYENFTADELIDFHQKRMSAEAVNKIRAGKRKVQP